jgi:ethanolamine utilization protein EutQ (cupin superfamily)
VPQLISQPAKIEVPGGKEILEYVGKVVTDTDGVSVAKMVAPPNWTEPFQTPEFDEVTLVIRGKVQVEHSTGATIVNAGEAILTKAGERIRYSTLELETEYVAVCVPAFTPSSVNRED